MHKEKDNQYTLFMETEFQNFHEELRSFYSREDFERLLKACQKADKASRKFREQDFRELCRAQNYDADAILREGKIPDNVLTRTEMRTKLLERFHTLYVNCPTSEQYMERIVRHLAPELDDFPVRTAILKKFVEGDVFHCKAIQTYAIQQWAYDRLSPEQQAAYPNADVQEQLKMLCAQIDDSIFTPEHLDTELQPAELLELMQKRLEKCRQDPTVHRRGHNEPFREIVLEPDTETKLLAFLNRCGMSAQAGMTATELLDKAITVLHNGASAEPDADWLDALTKDFQREMQQITCREKWKDDRRSAKRKKKSWELLQLCNDLASGAFRMNGGKNKQYLYYFAVMFRMTVPEKDAGNSGQTSDFQSLFCEYYNDNLLRYLDAGYDDPKYDAIYEKTPSGDGINYKNFVEVIYLYYMFHAAEMELTPGELIDRANAMADTCTKVAAQIAPELRRKNTPADYTLTFAEQFYQEVLAIPEQHLAEYLAQQYTIIVGEKKGSARIAIASETNTAYRSAQRIDREMDAEDMENTTYYAFHGSSDSVNQTTMREESGLIAGNFEWNLSASLQEMYPEDKRFLYMIAQIESRLSMETEMSSIKGRRIIHHLLHALYHASSASNPMSFYRLQEWIGKSEISVSRKSISNGIRILQKLGFDIAETEKSLSVAENTDNKWLRRLRRTNPAQTKAALTELKQQVWHDYSQTDRILLYEITRTLFCETDDTLSVTTERLKTLLSQKGHKLTDSKLQDAIKMLKKTGIQIKSKDKAFYLRSRQYESQELESYLNLLKARWTLNEELADEALQILLASTHAEERTISRSKLIALHLNQYITLLHDNDIHSFPELYEDYQWTINPILEEARCQKFNPSNILDMYVLISLYCYMIKMEEFTPSHEILKFNQNGGIDIERS